MLPPLYSISLPSLSILPSNVLRFLTLKSLSGGLDIGEFTELKSSMILVGLAYLGFAATAHLGDCHIGINTPSSLMILYSVGVSYTTLAGSAAGTNPVKFLPFQT